MHFCPMWQSQVISGRHDEKKERQVKNTGYFIQKTAQQKFRMQRLLTQSSKDKLVLFTYSIRKKSPDKLLVSKYETQEREFFFSCKHLHGCIQTYFVFHLDTSPVEMWTDPYLPLWTSEILL